MLPVVNKSTETAVLVAQENGLMDRFFIILCSEYVQYMRQEYIRVLMSSHKYN